MIAAYLMFAVTQAANGAAASEARLAFCSNNEYIRTIETFNNQVLNMIDCHKLRTNPKQP
jgi:hypothetical protein